MRTVFLGTAEFAVAILDRLAESEHKPSLVISRPDRPQGRGQKVAPPPVAARALELGIQVLQPEDLHSDETIAAIEAAEPDVLCLCAYGALVKAPILDRWEIFNVHPSLLPRWRGAAPVERAIMHGDEETGVSIMKLTEGLDAGPVCLKQSEPIRPDDDSASLAERLTKIGGDLLVRALDERPDWVEQEPDGVTYAEKLIPQDRMLDPTCPPEDVERVVRALRPHIGARLPMPDGRHLHIWDARVAGETLAPAGGRVRTEGDRLFLDCNGGALEILALQPPGGKRMSAADWLRGRPEYTDFWLDPRLPEHSLDYCINRAVEEWDHPTEWAPYLAALCWRGTLAVLDTVRRLGGSSDPVERSVAAYVLGQLGVPHRTFPEECALALESMAQTEHNPMVLATIANAFANLGDHGLDALLNLRDHEDALVRDGVARALAGRDDDRAVAALVELTRDPDPEVRDWATFSVGALASRDTPEIREALAERLEDDDEDTRVEAIHGLAVRGDERAVEPALALLEGGVRDGYWGGHALEEAAIRLAAISGDARFRDHLPPEERYAGTVLESELRTALDRTAG